MAPESRVVISNSEHELIENVAKYFLNILNSEAELVTVGVSGKGKNLIF